MINVLVWLLAFLMQAGLLGIVMYSVGIRHALDHMLIPERTACTSPLSLSQLISLSDLENDFVNPHDASAALNKWVVSRLRHALQAIAVHSMQANFNYRL